MPAPRVAEVTDAVHDDGQVDRDADAPGPLDGVRILDLTRLLPGGMLGALLGDLGADVVKVEEPGRGDYLRAMGATIGPQSAASWVLGRNKRSIAVDLKRPEGVELLLRLVERSDVLVEGFRPGVADRLGVGYDAVRGRNPQIVYASLTGYGRDGPMAAVAGHDINYIAYAGVLAITGPPGGPVCPPGVQVADLGGASFLGVGLLAALYRASRTGTGSRVEVALYDAALAWTSMHAGQYWATGQVPGPGDMLLNGGYPCYGVYECADGRYLSVGALEPGFWAAFCAGIAREDLVPRSYDPSARAEVAGVLLGRSRDDWVRVLGPVDACVAPVLDLGEALAHPMAAARHMVLQAPIDHRGSASAPTLASPVRVDGLGSRVRTAPPALGEHTVALAREAGLSPQEVDALLASGVLAQPGR